MSESHAMESHVVQGNEVLRLAGVCKAYDVGTPVENEVLHAIDLRLDRGTFASLTGPSGSGKSTLLNLIGLLDTPTSGELFVLERPTSAMDDQERTDLRGGTIGLVFQFHHLIQAFSVLDNVLMPLMIRQGRPTAAIIDRARELLAAVGLAAFASRRPNELSGGQQQRVAIARALVSEPVLLLADEPTGNLDTASADEVFELFRRFHAEHDCAVLIVSHDPRISARCDRVIELVDGRIVRDAHNRY
ncbi:ABC transporter ATP-binding protein [Billgrantia antri]|uniref:ABC transporter ATP-binding protein n=2 Tax=Halomonadaceae TaxID=28256 RepID=A0ABX7WGT1_9GAMM|nr:ABC transporter ATP-binding protein [Halomonas sulfidivorans]